MPQVLLSLPLILTDVNQIYQKISHSPCPQAGILPGEGENSRNSLRVNSCRAVIPAREAKLVLALPKAPEDSGPAYRQAGKPE
jgi:hypothetical protein